MTKRFLLLLSGSFASVFLALYLFAAYELLILPAVLDWSAYGVVLALALSGLLIWSVSAEKRLSATVLAFAFLLMIQALHNIADYPLWKEAAGGIFIFTLLFIVSRIIGKVSLRRFIVFFLVAVILNGAIDLARVPFWSEFSIKWESPALYDRYAAVDYFPLTLADLDGDQTAEIITQQNIAEAMPETAAQGKVHKILEPETNYYAVYKWDGQTFKASSYNPDDLKSFIAVDYLGFPFYTASLSRDKSGLRQDLTPLLDRTELAEEAVRFGTFPFRLLTMNRDSLTARTGSLPAQLNPIQTPAMAEGNFAADPEPELAVIDRELVVRKAGKGSEQLAVIDNRQIPDIGIGELLTGDVDRDGWQEILLTVENSRILKLNEDGRWQILWTNPEPFNPKSRFQKFRFEEFAKLNNNPDPEIIALAKSNVRENPTRYMTGYTFHDGTLKQNWRVFSGLINIRAGDVDGDKENELIGYMYRSHRIFVLEKHNLPVTQALYGITGLIIIAGFWRQRKNKRSRLGKRGLGLLLLVCILVISGCSISSGPKDFTPLEPPTRQPAPDAAERLTQAFADTAEKGTKFMYSGHAVTRVQKRNIGFYASGSYDRNKGYNMDGRILGQPFRFYRWGSDTYVSAEEKWKKAAPSDLPLEPFTGLTELQLPLEKAVRLPDDVILGKKCDVFQITLNAEEAFNAAKSMGLKTDGTQMTITYWIGKQGQDNDSSFLYQYKAETSMPIPAAGTMFQEVVFKFWNYNDQGIKIQSPDKIAPYLVKE